MAENGTLSMTPTRTLRVFAALTLLQVGFRERFVRHSDYDADSVISPGPRWSRRWSLVSSNDGVAASRERASLISSDAWW